MGKYWLDADVLIQAKNGLYTFNIAMKFWYFIEQQAKAGTLSSSLKVYAEILKYEDQTDPLTQWAKQRRNSGLFLTPEKDVQSAFREVADHVATHSQYAKRQAKIAEFLSGGDGWTIAHAKCDNGIVVTHENRLDRTALTPKIPNVCHHFGIGCITLPAMLEKLKFRF